MPDASKTGPACLRPAAADAPRCACGFALEGVSGAAAPPSAKPRRAVAAVIVVLVLLVGSVLARLAVGTGVDWRGIAMAAVLGAVAAGVGVLAGRAFGARGGRWLEPAVSAIAFILLSAVSARTIVPAMRASMAGRATDEALQKLEFFRELRRLEPQTYERARTQLAAVVARGGNVDLEGRRIGAQMAGPMVVKYLPKASDEAILRFLTALSSALQEIGAKSPVGAFALLFPAQARPGDLVALSPAAEAAMSDAMTGILTSGAAASATPHPPDTERAAAILRDRILPEIRPHVSGLASLARPADPAIDRAAAGSAAVALYTAIEELPPEDRVVVFRGMLSAAPASAAGTAASPSPSSAP